VQIVARRNDNLEDEDILEMVNPPDWSNATVVDSYVDPTNSWKEYIPEHTAPLPAASLRTNAQVCVGHSLRQSTRSGNRSNGFDREATFRVGTHETGNVLLKRYLQNTVGPAAPPTRRTCAASTSSPALLQEVRRRIRLRLAAAGGAGLPGITARPEHPQPVGRHRRDAGDATTARDKNVAIKDIHQ
jgi:hypothetical protein